MRVLQPLAITDSTLYSSSVTEADYPAWISGATYAVGDRRIRTTTHSIYERLTAGAGTTAPEDDELNWLRVGPTNRWGMFDDSPSFATTATSSISVDFTLAALDAVVLEGVLGSTVQIYSGTTGTTLVRTVTVPAPVAPATTSRVVASGLGIAAGNRLRILLSGTGTVQIGHVSIGSFVDLGETLSVEVGITDFSTVESNTYGALSLVRRAYSRKLGISVRIPIASEAALVGRLESLAGDVAYWDADSAYECAATTGWRKDWQLVLREATTATYSLNVNGLARDDVVLGAGQAGNGAQAFGLVTQVVSIYQRAASTPALPADQCVYAFTSGVLSGLPAAWSTTIPAGSSPLYVSQALATGTGATAVILGSAWSEAVVMAQDGAAGATGATGAAGANGQRVGVLEVYRWAASAPTTYPSGTSTYTWATGAFTAPTTANGWSLIPGAAVPGQTLWGISVSVSDNLTTATSTATWNSSTVYAVGAAGANGADNWDAITGKPASDAQLVRNLVDASTWVVGTTGAQAGFPPRVSPDTATSIILSAAPDGVLRPVWRAVSGASGTWQGGWDSTLAGGKTFTADPTKAYRFSVWFRPDVSLSTGTAYLGLYANTTGVAQMDTPGTINSNPYFAYRARNTFAAGRWYLAVGYIYPYGSGGVQSGNSGIYDGETGAKVFTGTDLVWYSATPGSAGLRTYQFSTTVAGSTQDWWGPRVEMCDGSEPSLQQLLAPALKSYSSALVYLFQRSATVPAVPAATLTWTFATASLSGTLGAWSTTVPAGTNPLYVTVATARGSAATDTIDPAEWATPVVMAQDGAAGATGATGATGAAGANAATVFLFQRTATATPPSLPSASVTYTFATGAATGVNNGWAQSMPTTGGAYRWVTTATALGTGATDTIAAAEWATAALQAQDGATGATGAAGANGQRVGVLEVYRWAASAPTTYPSGTSTYTWATGAFTAPTTANGWSLIPGAAVPGQTLWGISVSVSDNLTTATSTATWNSSTVYAVGAAGANGATGATGPAGATGAQGQRGSIEASRAISGSAWSDSEANAAISAAGYGSPVRLDRVTLYNAGANFVASRYFDGANWITWSALVDGNLLVTGSVGANKLAVTQLSAITATIGTLRTATTGGRMELSDNVLKVYDASNVLRVRLGNLSL